MKAQKRQLSPQVKQVLEILGRGVLLSTLVIFPHAGVGVKAIYDEYKRIKREADFREWERFNLPRMRTLVKRLLRQKMVTMSEKDGYSIVKLTKKGKTKTLQYKLEEMMIKKPAIWDHKWRLVIYDITIFKRRQQSAFRRMLKKMRFLPLQKSVYLTPYPCSQEVEFLRTYFGIDEGVLYIVAEQLENADIYRRYFGL